MGGMGGMGGRDGREGGMEGGSDGREGREGEGGSDGREGVMGGRDGREGEERVSEREERGREGERKEKEGVSKNGGRESSLVVVLDKIPQKGTTTRESHLVAVVLHCSKKLTECSRNVSFALISAPFPFSLCSHGFTLYAGSKRIT
jgi:hypothetical protein